MGNEQAENRTCNTPLEARSDAVRRDFGRGVGSRVGLNHAVVVTQAGHQLQVFEAVVKDYSRAPAAANTYTACVARPTSVQGTTLAEVVGWRGSVPKATL